MVQRAGGGWKAGPYAACEWVCEEHGEIVPAWAANSRCRIFCVKEKDIPGKRIALPCICQ